MWPTTRYTFLSRMHDSKHVAPNGAFGLLINDSYRPIAPTELISVLSPSRRLYEAGGRPLSSVLCPLSEP